MGSYEQEMKLVAQGKAQRGKTAIEYLDARDATLQPDLRGHRPNYAKTLFAPENDDIYQEFCRFIDMPEPRYLDQMDNPLAINGYTAADVYHSMLAHNEKLFDIDAVATFNMLVTMRDNPQLAERIVRFTPQCDHCGVVCDHG